MNPPPDSHDSKPSLFPWWANPFRTLRHPGRAAQDVSQAGKEAIVRFGKDIWFNFAAFPAATIEGLQAASVQYQAESEFDRQVRYRVWIAYLLLGTAAVVLWWGLWTIGVNNALGSLPFFGVATLWFLRVRGTDPVKNWIRANLEVKRGPSASPARPAMSPALLRAMLRLRLKEVGGAIRRWENLKTSEQEDDAVILAHQIIQVLVNPLEQDLAGAAPGDDGGTPEAPKPGSDPVPEPGTGDPVG